MAACVLIYCPIAQGTFSWAALMVLGPAGHKVRGLVAESSELLSLFSWHHTPGSKLKAGMRI